MVGLHYEISRISLQYIHNQIHFYRDNNRGVLKQTAVSHSPDA
jgi:uncharacterized membrane-anchored protein